LWLKKTKLFHHRWCLSTTDKKSESDNNNNNNKKITDRCGELIRLIIKCDSFGIASKYKENVEEIPMTSMLF